MAGSKFKMPTDKQIWAEVDLKIASMPEPLKQRVLPSREQMFASKKAWYKDTPKRLAAQEKAEKAAAKKQADADKAYLALRKSQGKPIVSVEQVVKQFPGAVEENLSKVSQQKLHEFFDAFTLVSEAEVIQKKVTRIRALSRKFLFAYLAQTYGVYKRILRSESPDTTFEFIRGFLWKKHKINTHSDIPRSSLLLKLVFEGASEKTIHLYTRAFQLADGYDVEEAEFSDFIKQLGGMEKIRKAYATVIAADAGKLITSFDKEAEYSASLNVLRGQSPMHVVELAGGQGASFRNDLFGQFCLVVAHIDPLNQLELYGQLPATKAIESDVLKRISEVQKAKGGQEWLQHKGKATASKAKQLKEEMIAKADMQLEKEAKDKKKAEALAKKNAALEKRYAKERAAAAKTIPKKSAAKSKAVAKKN